MITREMRSHGGVRENSEILSFEVEFQILQIQLIENTQQISSILKILPIFFIQTNTLSQVILIPLKSYIPA